MITDYTSKYNELFEVDHNLNWCKHKKTLWNLLVDHINDYFEKNKETPVTKDEVIDFIDEYFKATNFGYAYYQPLEGDPLFLIAKSKESLSYIHNKGDMNDVFKAFREKMGLVFCVQDNHHQHFKQHRVDEDLSFREISIVDPTIKFLAQRQTCCERMIFENIVWCLYGLQGLEENFNFILSGEIKIFTEMEPCIRCYGLMSSIKETHNLEIKVRYNEWAPKELQYIADSDSLVHIIELFTAKDFNEEGELKQDIIDEATKEVQDNGVSPSTAFVRVANRLYPNKGQAKCDYKSTSS
ncbi:hypothetical protein [Priestia aryabhattai]|uniref:hypothetical protein n=1 Tax=Priestia aryabhattai TaxID=412384 RepID=UPI0008DE74E0|nr:hypothetical protein [Priestia aryabhattai]OHY73283.1 hypothetical protein BCV52_27160 [Priestia aryabhattai]